MTSYDFDYLFRILFVGNSQVGKSSILLRYTECAFMNNYYYCTVGVDFKIKQIQVDNNKCKLQLWDYPRGCQRFRSISSSYYRGLHGIIFVYDITNMESFESIKNIWYGEFKKHRLDNRGDKHYSNNFGYNYETYTPQVLILGTKSDLRNQSNYNSCVDFNIVREFAQSINALSFEVSSKDNIGIDESIFETVSNLRDNYLKSNGKTHSEISGSIKKPSSSSSSNPNPTSSKCLIN